MIYGIVKNGRATVNIIFRLPNQPDFTIKFVIDTGFTEFLSLPPTAVTLLGFPFVYDMYANLADNSNVILPVHQATIIRREEIYQNFQAAQVEQQNSQLKFSSNIDELR
ncbi:MAG: clan AA aspartic protease [Nostoc sp.]|uniref:clan AA aspartic protease n=1 Tax=Nostoc sp. TaxID=1180 RepID=UPI002FF0040A